MASPYVEEAARRAGASSQKAATTRALAKCEGSQVLANPMHQNGQPRGRGCALLSVLGR